MSTVQSLAGSLSTKSALALRLLKSHLSRSLLAQVEALAPAELVAERAAQTNAEVRVIRLDQRDVATVTAQLSEALSQCEAANVSGGIVLWSEVAPFDGSETAEQVLALASLIAASPVAVVAALGGDAQGAAWWLSLACDGSVYSAAGWYGAGDACAHGALAVEAAWTLPACLGAALGEELLLTGEPMTGAQLQSRAGGLTVVSADRVLSTAQALAQAWQAQPAPSVSGWKRMRASQRRQRIDARPGWEVEAEPSNWPSPGVVALETTVVTATVHADGVLEIALHDREAKNMFSDALVSGAMEAFAHVASTAYKVVVLTGYDSYFASGGTKESLLAIQSGTAKFTDFKIFQLAMQCEVPVIAAMQGHGIGAGWSLGMFADVVLFGEESHYVSPYMNYGFTPGAGSTLMVPTRLGQDLGRESLLTGHEYVGRELGARGIAQRVLPREQVLAEAHALARRMARSTRGVLKALKRQWTASLLARVEETYAQELSMHDETFVGRADTRALIEGRFARTVVHEVRHAAAMPAAVAMQSVEHQAIAIETPDAVDDDRDALATVTRTLRKLLAHELQLSESEIDDEAQFVDLGLDSIVGVTWVRKINETYGLEIEATKVYSHPTLAQLSRHVKDEAERLGTLPKPKSCARMPQS